MNAPVNTPKDGQPIHISLPVEGMTCASCVGRVERALKAVPGITVVEEENVLETIAVQKTMESMIKLDGAKLIFATSFGYFDPHMIEMATKFPDVEFRHALGLWQAGKHPKNAGSYHPHLPTAA